jgi:hypothetical protein
VTPERNIGKPTHRYEEGIFRLKDLWNHQTKSWKDFENVLKPFFQRNPRTQIEMHRKIKISVNQGIFMEKLENTQYRNEPSES